MAGAFLNDTRTECLPWEFDDDDPVLFTVCLPQIALLAIVGIASGSPASPIPAIVLALLVTGAQGLSIWDSISDSGALVVYAVWILGPLLAASTAIMSANAHAAATFRRVGCLAHAAGWSLLITPYMAELYGDTTPQSVARFYFAVPGGTLGDISSDLQSTSHAVAGAARTLAAALCAQVALERPRKGKQRPHIFAFAAGIQFIVASVLAEMSDECPVDEVNMCYVSKASGVLCGDASQQVDCDAEAEQPIIAAGVIASAFVARAVQEFLSKFTTSFLAIAIRAGIAAASVLPYALITPLISGRVGSVVGDISAPHNAPCNPWQAPVAYLYLGAAQMATAAFGTMWMLPTKQEAVVIDYWHDRPRVP